MLCKFFLLGGTCLAPTTDDAATHENAELAEFSRRILACWKFIHQHDCSIGIRALANVLCENITDLDDIVWVLRQEARVADISWIPFFEICGNKNFSEFGGLVGKTIRAPQTLLGHILEIVSVLSSIRHESWPR